MPFSKKNEQNGGITEAALQAIKQEPLDQREQLPEEIKLKPGEMILVPDDPMLPGNSTASTSNFSREELPGPSDVVRTISKNDLMMSRKTAAPSSCPPKEQSMKPSFQTEKIMGDFVKQRRKLNFATPWPRKDPGPSSNSWLTEYRPSVPGNQIENSNIENLIKKVAPFYSRTTHESPHSSQTVEDFRSESLDLLYPMRSQEERAKITMQINRSSPILDNEQQVLPTSGTCEVLSQFMISQGIPFENIKDSSFKKLLEHFEPGSVVPTVKELERSMKFKRTQKPIDLSIHGPVSITVDLVKHFGDAEDKMYLVFSVHHFENSGDRTDAVFLKRVGYSQLNYQTIVMHIRDSMSIHKYKNLSVTNILASNRIIAHRLENDVHSTVNFYICFQHHITSFVCALLDMEPFSSRLQNLREFVRKAKSDYKMRSYMHECLNKKKKYSDNSLPPMEDTSWQSKMNFLKRCLELSSLFLDTVILNYEDFGNATIITSATFIDLKVIFKILQVCSKYSQELSGPDSSVSQVIPAIRSIRSCLVKVTVGKAFGEDVRKCFTDTFQDFTAGPTSMKYHIATILDPRFAYCETMYQNETWSAIEGQLRDAFVSKRFTAKDISQLKYTVPADRESRIKIFSSELENYKQILKTSDSENFKNPFKFWKVHQRKGMKSLAFLARYYLACPAVAIDANYFVGEGSGSLVRACNMYRDEVELAAYLNAAAVEQQYRGIGFRYEEDEGESNTTDAGDKPSTSGASTSSRAPKRSLEARNSFTEQVPPKRLAESFIEPVRIPEIRSSQQLIAGPPETLDKDVKQEPIETEEFEKIYVKREAVEEDEEYFVEREIPAPSLSPPAEILEKPKWFRKTSKYDAKIAALKKDPKPAKPVKVPVSTSCVQCGTPKHEGLRKRECVPDDRLPFLLNAVRKGAIPLELTPPIFNRKAIFFCLEHMHETCDELFKMFGVNSPEEIFRVDPSSVDEELLRMAAYISGRESISAQLLKCISYKFTVKYLQKTCAMCDLNFYRKDMMSISREAWALAQWIDCRKLELTDSWKHKNIKDTGKLYEALKEDTDGYLCMNHFPENCLSKRKRHLLDVERVFGEDALVDDNEYEEEEEEELEDDYVEKEDTSVLN